MKLAGVRSLLFVPGDDEHKLRRALESEADGVIADLEDAVVARSRLLDDGRGVALLQGQIVDRPVVLRARRILEHAEQGR